MIGRSELPFVYFVAGPRDCVTPGGSHGDIVLIETAKAAATGGATWFQLRHKPASQQDVTALAHAIMEELVPAGVTVLINDDFEVARTVGAHGVHLGQSDGSVIEARRALGPNAIIGLSVETEAQLQEAYRLYLEGTIDYAGISPVFPTRTKTDLSHAWGLEGLARARRLAPEFPFVAIGGIKARNAHEVAVAGADCVAVVSEITRADNPQAAAQRLADSVRWGRDYLRALSA